VARSARDERKGGGMAADDALPPSEQKRTDLSARSVSVARGQATLADFEEDAQRPGMQPKIWLTPVDPEEYAQKRAKAPKVTPESFKGRPPKRMKLPKIVPSAVPVSGRPRRVFDRPQRPPSWRAVFTTAALSLAAALASYLFLVVAYSLPFDSYSPWIGWPIVIIFFSLTVPFPLAVRGVGTWLRTSGACVVLASWVASAELLKDVSAPLSDILGVLGAFPGVPAALLVGLRQGAASWRRPFLGTGGAVLGILTLVAFLEPLNRAVEPIGTRHLEVGIIVHAAFLIVWVPVSLVDKWFDDVDRTINLPASAPTPPRTGAVLPVPLAPFRCVAAALFVVTLVLPWTVVTVRTAVQNRSVSRGAARPEMVVVPPGDLAVTTTEVTRGQFELVMGFDPSTAPDDPALPVESVTAREAISYCNRLSKIDGREQCYHFSQNSIYFAEADRDCNGYRLPTEDEWRSKIHVDSAVGLKTVNFHPEQAWFREDAGGRPHPVASKRPDARGLYDVLGNVSEFAIPRYSYATNVSAIGGSWQDTVTKAEVPWKGDVAPDQRSPAVGFRIVRTLKVP
jgi:formylglycine-generating enzyme